MLIKEIKYIRKVSDEYPFNIRFIKNFNNLVFDTPITFIVGENASGKSTLIEAIACSLGLVTVGNDSVLYDDSLEHARKLGKQLKISFIKHASNGFFLRSEDFINFCRKQREMTRSLKRDLKDMEREFKDKSEYAKGLMRGPLLGSINALETKYDGYLDEKSHGESFLTLFKNRLVPNGIYILDEPEVSLSPQNQYALMALIIDGIKNGSQFIIATHSPIIQALPYSTIYDISSGDLKRVKYEELESFQFFKSFLSNYEQYVAYLEFED